MFVIFSSCREHSWRPLTARLALLNREGSLQRWARARLSDYLPVNNETKPNRLENIILPRGNCYFNGKFSETRASVEYILLYLKLFVILQSTRVLVKGDSYNLSCEKCQICKLYHFRASMLINVYNCGVILYLSV